MTKRPDKTTLSIPPDVKKEARIKALKEHVSLSDAVTRFLRAWVADELELPTKQEEGEKSPKE